MSLKYLLSLWMALALAGYAPRDVQAVRPEPRLLGVEVSAYQAPPQPPAAAMPTREAPEPTGVLTLPQAQAGDVWLEGAC
jgi:hypothetical protein